MQRTNRRMRLGRLMTTVFAVGFVASIFFTISAFAAANLFKIQNAELSELSATAEGAIASFDEENIVSDVTFHKLDDFAKYTITLKNTDSVGHVIESITDDNENPYVSYEYNQHAGEQIDAGADLVFVVTAKYTTAVTDMSQRAQATNVKFFIHFTDIDEEIPVVPNTGASAKASSQIYFSVASLVISAAGLTVIGIIALKKHKKASKYIIAGIIAVAAVATTATVKAATVAINSFTLTTNYTLKDRLVVTWTDANGDEHETLVPYNEPANIPDPNKDGHTFTGWVDENNNPVDLTQPTTEDIKIRPTFRVHQYTIRFNGNGATSGEMTDLAMTFGEAKTLPTNAFTWAGHEYTGWDTEANGSGAHYGDAAEVTDLTTEDNVVVALYAQWSVNPFHIDYDGNGAMSGEMATTNCEYDQACQLRDNAFSKPGYHFTGWKYNNNDYTNKADVTNIIESGTITMVAQWAANHYTIIFDINTEDPNAAGNMADMTNLEYDHDYTLTANAFTRTGYNFGGWNTEIDGRNFGLTDEQEFHNLTTTDSAIITLYAQWNPIHYTIAFHQNSDGVTGNMSSQVFTYDEAKNLTQNAFIKNHYKFMGWTTAANGTGTKYDDRASIFNLTTEDGATIDLYAQWKERTAYLKGTVNNSWGSAGDMIRSLQGYSAATSFSHYEGEPNFDEIGTKYNMAISSSNFPVYTWIDGETIYWWSEAETIYAHEDSRNFFSGLKKAETIDYSGFNFSLTKNLAGFFRNTEALSTIDLSPLAAANPTSLEEMFYGSGIASVDLSPLNTTQTINMKGMFNSTTALETVNLSAINTANVTDMSYLFSNSTNLKSVDFSHNNLSSVEDMNHMFYSDKKLESLNFAGVNTPNLKKMSWMFGGAKIASLDLGDLDTGNVTHFDELFYYADVASLDISGFDTHNATTFGSMFTAFNAHGQVLDLSHFDTISLNGSMYEMFLATNASVIDLSSFDISAERAANIGMANILHISNSVETIYATEKLHFHDYSSVPDTSLGVPMDYGGQSKLVGGAGSTLRQLTMLGLSEYDKARIDDPCNGKPGMFAVKNAQYICYNANIPSGETGAGAQAGEYLTVGTGNLTANSFVREGYNFAGWVDDDNNNYADGAEVTIAVESKTPLNLYAVWEPKTLTITFDKNDTYAEGEMGTQTVTYTATETLNANTFTNYQHTFLGWNTQADGKGTHYDNHTEIEITIPHDFTLYAEWKAELEVTSMNPGEDLTMLSADKANEDVQVAEGTKCKRAIQLHEEICVSGHCTDLGYTETGSKGTNVVRYGSFGTQGGPLNSGDAFTCDVDGNGVFDEKYERFYYVSDYWNTNTREFEDDTAVLIYYRSTYLGQGNTVVQSASYRRDITLGPDVTNMPRNSLWRNVSLKNTERNILAFREGEEMTNEIEAGTLPSNFSYEGYSARYLTIPEAKVGCGVVTIQGNSTETDSTCMYMYENSRFVINDMGRTESIGVPLENPYITHGATAESDLNRRWFIQSRSGAGFQNGWTSSRISARPVIEVPKHKISY